MKQYQNIILCMGAILLFLLSFEIFLRIISYREIAYKSEINIGLNNTDKYILSDNPKLLYELKPNCTLNCEPTNSFGIRDKEYSFQKPIDTVRMILVGDSVLYGPNVEDNERFSELLEEKLNKQFIGKYEVMNFGVAGYDIHQEYEVVKRIFELNPDIIVLDAFTNDAAIKIVSNDKKLIYEVFEEYNYLYESYLSKLLLKYSYVYRFFNHRLIKVFKLPVKLIYSPNFDFYQDKLNKMRNIIERKNIKFFVVFHPSLINHTNISNINKINTENQYTKIFENLNLTYLDLTSYYSKIKPEKLRINTNDTTHLSAYGHAVTADAIYNYITKK